MNTLRDILSTKTIHISTKRKIVLLVLITILIGITILTKYFQPPNKEIAASTELTSSPASLPAQVNQSRAITNAKLTTMPSIWPTSGEVTSGFGWRTSPWGSESELHAGVDIANAIGTPVVATADGKVVQSGWSEGYGNIVQIDHGNGLATIYGHNSQLMVSQEQRVKKGQIIARVGNTGRSTGPHLHYEVRENGNSVNPVKFLISQTN